MEIPRFHPRRELGRTGFQATILGIGDIADRTIESDRLVATLERAMDAGLNVIDTAPGYEHGYSEEIVGKALRGRRDGMFVIDKIDHIGQPVTLQVDESLKRLGLDGVDLFVFHAVSNRNQWEWISGPGMEELGRCVRKGKVRFRGISCHNPEVLRDAVSSGLCDVVMFPVGPVVDPGYVESVLPLTREHRVGTVCFKTFGAGKLLGDTLGYGQPLRERPRGKFGSHESAVLTPQLPHLDVETCVRYTLTCDPDVALLGMSLPGEQDPALLAASRFVPFTPGEMARVRQRAEEAITGKGGMHWDPDPHRL